MKTNLPMKADGAHLKHVAVVIRKANEHGDFVELEDGYVHYWPTNDASRGALPAWALRELADELDRRNAAWDAIIQGDHRVGCACVQVWKWDDAPEQFKNVHVTDGDEDWLALVPNQLIEHGDVNAAEICWMRWFPRGDGFVKRYSEEGVPEGFEIWVGCHA